MAHAIFDLKSYDQLPLWGQVLLASRLLRRAILALPEDAPASTRPAMLAGCDAIDRSACAGAVSHEDKAALKRAAGFQPTCYTMAVATSMNWAVDAVLAAEDSTSFSAAEAACGRSVGTALMWAMEADGMTGLQAGIYAATDLDLIRFACAEFRIGRYDGLTMNVMSRLVPIVAPAMSEQAPTMRSGTP